MRIRSPLVIGGRSAAPGLPAASRATSVRAGCWRCRSRCTHPGSRRSHASRLQGARVRTLVIQGESDPFGTPEEFPGDIDLAVVPAADHSMKVPKSAPVSQADALAVVLEATLEWVVREVSGNRND